MAIHVSSVGDYPHKYYPDATGWHVDDYGYLHITKAGGGNVATFHSAAWVCAEKYTDESK